MSPQYLWDRKFMYETVNLDGRAQVHCVCGICTGLTEINDEEAVKLCVPSGAVVLVMKIYYIQQTKIRLNCSNNLD